ncbi:MAG: iron-sulfur cluster assembly scaffold protein [Chloroflexota bacterium]|nr:iron-sulfur cluster assembly scaffold protein [Chloroflexota bacterium]
MPERPQMSREDFMAFILDHREKPRNNHAMDNPTVEASGGNPGCGDIVTVYLNVDDDRITDISYVGEGCTISQAGASFMTSRLKGKTLAEVEAMDYDIITDTFGREVMATRPRCATLALGTIKSAVRKYRDEARKQSLNATPEMTDAAPSP